MAAAYPWSEASRCKAWMSLACLMLAGALVLIGLVFGPSPPVPPINGHTDRALYQEMLRGVSEGRSYYVAAPAALRANKYPLRPFLAVRPPELTVTLALLPGAGARQTALLSLAALTLGAWAWRLRALWREAPFRYALALLLLASGLVVEDPAYLFHEAWAGDLMALSLALHRPGRWSASLIVGLAAALLRELAIPFLGVMAVVGWLQGRRGEAFAWTLVVMAALGALLAHALVVGAVTRAGDPQSPGWLAFGGWPFVLAAVQYNSLLPFAPKGFIAILLPLALLGLAFTSTGGGLRVTVIVWGFVAGLLVVGRPENTYWGLMIAPLWPLGLAFADRGVKRVITQSRRLFASAPEGAAGIFTRWEAFARRAFDGR